MKIITGSTGTPHITPEQDAMWHRGIWNKDCIIKDGNNMSYTIQSNNEIRIKDGICSIQGRFACIDKGTYETVRIDNGLQGQKRIDLIVIVYEKNTNTNYESMSIQVKKGYSTTSTPSVPSYTKGTIGIDRRVEVPLYEVHLTNLSVATVKPKLEVLSPIESRVSTLESRKSITVDYITSVTNWNASGVTNGKIVKYSSGRCEIYGSQTFNASFTVSRGSNMYSTDALTLTLPVTFRSKPVATADVNLIAVGYMGYIVPEVNKLTYALVNTGSKSGNVTVHWRITGQI